MSFNVVYMICIYNRCIIYIYIYTESWGVNINLYIYIYIRRRECTYNYAYIYAILCNSPHPNTIHVLCHFMVSDLWSAGSR